MWESDDVEGGARIIYMGARPAMDGQRVALFEVGERWTRAILGDERQPLMVSSLPLGTLGLREGWFCSDPPAASERALISEWVRTVMGPTIARFREVGFDAVALTSTTAVALARLAGRPMPHAGASEHHRLSLHSLCRCERALGAMTARERAKLPGLDAAGADSIVAGAIILRSILESTELDEALVCHATVGCGAAEDGPAETAADASTGRLVCRMKEGPKEDLGLRRLFALERTGPEASREHHSPLPHTLSVSGVGV
jgi:exopolyphosphatase/pppGpp-phosphohydrolase